MKNIKYKPSGTCSSEIDINLDDNDVIRNVSVVGGCSGNLQGISKLLVGMKAPDVIARFEGIRCGFKSTSCPDQIAKALKKGIAE